MIVSTGPMKLLLGLVRSAGSKSARHILPERIRGCTYFIVTTQCAYSGMES